MKTFTYTLTHPNGLHGRPAMELADFARTLDSAVTVRKGERSAPADHLMALMLLGASQGDEVTVTVEGDGEEKDLAALEDFFRANL